MALPDSGSEGGGSAVSAGLESCASSKASSMSLATGSRGSRKQLQGVRGPSQRGVTWAQQSPPSLLTAD
eukprot:1140267-Pelagomonas_calceolata.AAC.1